MTSQKLKVNGSNEIKSRKEPFENLKSDFDAFENFKFTDEARHIKNDIFNSLIEFNKGHLKTITNQIISDLPINQINDVDELAKIKKISLATNDKEKINSIILNNDLKSIYDSTNLLLQQVPKKENIIEILENNQSVSHWVKTGIPLHQNQTNCFFCNGILSNERLKELLDYFNNESSKLKDDITSKIEFIRKAINEITSLEIPVSKFVFFENYQEDFQQKYDSFQILKQNLLAFYENLISFLNEKNDKSIFLNKSLPIYNSSLEDEILQWLNSTNEIIDKHNNLFDNFNEIQNNSRQLLKKHQVATFLIDEDYKLKKSQCDFSIKCINRYNNYIKKIDLEINKLEAELKSIVKGKEELNGFIQKFLNRNEICIDVINDDKFILNRNGKIADNLSEGEKTAISFSYFLVTLESLFRENKLFEYIVFIDDPISSLDGNHIAQIYSLINSFFFRQKINPVDPNQYVNCFSQLFLSSHNFEFFSFIKDSNRINKKNTKEYYYIKRIADDDATIQELPKSLRDYKSEYIYLFDIIYNFYTNGCQENDEKFILMPNAVRRFLEIYTLIKLPDSTDEVDARIKILMPEPTELKLLHHFSHFTTFEKVMKHDEIILNLPQAIGELIVLLEKDNLHFDSLKKAIGK